MENPNQASLKDIIKTLLYEIEKNDAFMRKHAERVASNCLRFSKMLGLSKDKINEMYLAGLLHDIGYIFLPSEILQKRCQLNKEEEEVIKRHPLISEKIISKYPMLSGILPIIRHHHESVDGGGYPDGLTENDIPPGAKILSIVNWFDTMTVIRSSPRPMNPDGTLEMIWEKAGKKFNKELAERFISFIKNPDSDKDEGLKETTQSGNNQKEAEPELKGENAPTPAGEIIQKIINRYKRDELELPVLPRVVREIRHVMNNPARTIDELASIIERDAVISVRLISVANSPLFRGSEKVITVKQAIPRVGVEETHSIVTTIANKSIYDTKDKEFKSIMEKLWLHSLASGYIARALSRKLKQGDIEEYYFMGLIHDIGKVLLLKTFGDIHVKTDYLDVDGIMAAIHEAHTSFGGAILRKWGYSETLARIPLLHEGPDFRSDADREILTINLASNIAISIGYGIYENICPEPSNSKSAILLEADLGLIEEISREAKTLMGGVSELF